MTDPLAPFPMDLSPTDTVMDRIASLSSYELSWHFAPFAVAAIAVIAISVYAAAVVGNRLLRATFLVFSGSLIPLTVCYALASITPYDDLALELYHIALAPLLFAPAGVLLFELALTQWLFRYRWVAALALGVALLNAVLMLATDLYIDGIWWMPSGMPHFEATAAGSLYAGLVAVEMLASIAFAMRRFNEEKNPLRRRQIKNSMIGFSVCSLGLVDLLLAYRIGWFPISWLFITVGALLLLRALIADDLVEAKALDSAAPIALLYTVAAVLGVWTVRALVEPHDSIWVATALMVAVYVALRLGLMGLRALRLRRGSLEDTPLERVLNQYIARIHDVRNQTAIGELTQEAVALGLGRENADILLPSEADYSWQSLDGRVLSEEATPDPMTMGWFIDNPRPLHRDQIQAQRLGSLREPIERLFERHRAEVLVPLLNRDVLVGILVLGASGYRRTWRREELDFLTRVQEQLTNALVYARMDQKAIRRNETAKEMQVAAAVQSAFVPKSEVVVRGSLTVAGLYAPARACGGDWWSVHELPDQRVLVLVGDVTGHGVGAARVTAAAKGCYDVAQHLMGADMDLGRLLELLHASVRRVGADDYHMTCFATLIDADRGTVSYANAGHVVPYFLRRHEDGRVELGALVARGNPLGTQEEPRYDTNSQEIYDGDILIWYTDGIVECTNLEREQFGDRRMQRQLRKLDQISDDVASIRDHLVRAAFTFQGSVEPDDDITLVVAKVG